MTEEGLEAYHPGPGTRPRVLYKNLYRYVGRFIGGTIAFSIDGREECAEGVYVTLSTAAGAEVGRCHTDNYGDFKFDGLEANSGHYSVRLALDGYETQTIPVDLKESAYLGIVFLTAVNRLVRNEQTDAVSG